MRIRSFVLTAAFASTCLLHAQKSELSFGLNTFGANEDWLGLGGTVDFRWHSGERTELIGQFSQTSFFELRDRTDRNGRHINADNAGDNNIQVGGFGFGYRFGKEAKGFHLGLLAGAARHEGVDMDDVTRHLISPSLGLTMGHPIGKRWDISVDAWMIRTEKAEYIPYPLLRLSFSPWRKR